MAPRRPQHVRSFVVLALLSSALAVTTLRIHSTIESPGPIALAAITVAAVLVTTNRSSPLSLQLSLAAPLAIVLAVLGLQVIPLPKSFIGLLSPVRYDALTKGSSAIGDMAHAALSAAPGATLPCAVGALACVVLFVSIRSAVAGSGLGTWAFMLPVIGIGGFEASVGLAQQLTGSSPTPVGTFYYRNHYASYLAMCLPMPVMLGIAMALKAGRSPGLAVRSFLSFLAAALVLTALALAGSRMGYFSAIAGLIAMGVANSVLSTHRRRPHIWTWVGITVVAVVGTMVFFLLAPTLLIDRFSQAEAAAWSRVDLWRDAAAVINSHPIAGCGYCAYWSGAVRFQTVMPTFDIDYAHNDYLQLAAELGIPGALALVGLAFATIRIMLRRARSACSSEYRYRALACFAALIAIGIHTMFDFTLHLPANLMLIAWIAGIGTADVGEPAPRPAHEPA